MKKILLSINILLMLMVFSINANAQENKSYSQGTSFWYDDLAKTGVITGERHIWTKVSDNSGTDIIWRGSELDNAQPWYMLAQYKKGVYTKSYDYVVLNVSRNDTLSAFIDHPEVKGLSKLEIESNSKPFEVIINDKLVGVYAGSAIEVDYIDAEGPYEIKLVATTQGANPRIKSFNFIGWTPTKFTGAATSEDGLSVDLQLSTPLTAKDTTMLINHGFSINVDEKPWEEEVAIEKVRTSADGQTITIHFTAPTFRHHNVLVSFDRTVNALVGNDGNSLQSIDAYVAANNSPIVPPTLKRPVETNLAGDEVTIRFDKSMSDYNLADGGGFTVVGSVSGSVAINALVTSPDNNELMIATLASPLVADDYISLNYSGQTLQSTDGGILEEVSDFPVVNNIIGAKAELVIMPATDLLGKHIALQFSKELNAIPAGEESAFVIKVDGVDRTVTAVELDSDDAHIVYVHMASPTVNINNITISYNGGSHTTIEGAAIRSFSGESVRNNSPGIPPVSLVATTLGAIDTIAAVVEFDIFLRASTIGNIKKGDFIVEITKIDGSVIKDSVENFRWINSLKFLAMDFTKPVLYTDDLKLVYTGTELQGFDRGVILPFNQRVHSQLAGADAHAINAEMSEDISSIFVEFTQDLDVNYVFDDHESDNINAQQVNINPGDFMVSINDNDSIYNPDILPTKRSFPTFISRYFYDENSLIVNLDLNFYQVTDWDTLTQQTSIGQVEWMFYDSTRVTVVETYLNDAGEYNWNRVDDVTGRWVPQFDNLLEARTDSGLVKWQYKGVEMPDTLGRFVPESDTLVAVEFYHDVFGLHKDTIVVKNASSVEFTIGDTITGSFQSYMFRGDITWNYGDTTIVSTGRNVPMGTLDLAYDINGRYTALLDTTYLPTDSVKIFLKGGDEINLTYTPGTNKVKTVEKAYDEWLFIPDSMAIVNVQPEYDELTKVITAPVQFAGSIFKDSVRTVDDSYWILTLDYKYKEVGMRSGTIQPFSFDFNIPVDAVIKNAQAKDFIKRPVPDKEETVVYPLVSPVESVLTINNADGFTEVTIYSMTGKLMTKQLLSEPMADIAVSHMPRGIYIVVLSGSENRQRFSGKIVKQ